MHEVAHGAGFILQLCADLPAPCRTLSRSRDAGCFALPRREPVSVSRHLAGPPPSSDLRAAGNHTLPQTTSNSLFRDTLFRGGNGVPGSFISTSDVQSFWTSTGVVGAGAMGAAGPDAAAEGGGGGVSAVCAPGGSPGRIST